VHTVAVEPAPDAGAGWVALDMALNVLQILKQAYSGCRPCAAGVAVPASWPVEALLRLGRGLCATRPQPQLLLQAAARDFAALAPYVELAKERIPEEVAAADQGRGRG